MVWGLNAARLGALCGAIVGVIVLLVLAVLMLQSEASSYKVLGAIVLWALPFPGFGAGIGWLLGSLVDGVTRRSARHSRKES